MNPQPLSDQQLIKVRKSSLTGSIRIPASKSHTIRALAIAALAGGECVIRNPLNSADTLSCVHAISALGARVDAAEEKWIVQGCPGRPRPYSFHIDVGNSGTTLRLLTAAAALADQEITFDGDRSIRSRPMQPLLSALKDLGVTVTSSSGKCPLSVRGPIKGGKTTVNGISSQFLSALLMACPLAPADSEILVENLHERPYVEMTLSWLRHQSIAFENRGLDWFLIKGGQCYRAFDRDIPADFSSATFALCAAAITGSKILLKGLDFSDSQGDKEVFRYLEEMGVTLKHTAEGVRVVGGNLVARQLDLNSTPDALPALAVVGCFARGKTILKNVAQARLKECDRIHAAAVELGKMGADISEMEDGLIIRQSKLTGCRVHGYHDHRLVMALAIAGMASHGETMIDTADSIQVTYPGFVQDMKALGAQIDLT